MKPSEVLREAARLVHEGAERYGCDAINRAAGRPDEDEATDLLWDLYFGDGGPDGCQRAYFWGHQSRHPARIIGLCLAAAIAESEGR